MATGLIKADGILSRVVRSRGSIHRVVIVGKTKVSYLIGQGTSWSHGETLAQARESLLYKIGSRDTSEFKKWNLKTKVSKRDGIRAYRVITGACESGTKDWASQRELPESITVSGIIELTRGSYGADKFAAFFAVQK